MAAGETNQQCRKKSQTNLEELLSDLNPRLESVRRKELPQKIDKIGEGKYGTVSSYQPTDGDQIAGKKARINLFAGRNQKEEQKLKKALQNAVKEVHTLKQLNHNRIIKFIDCYWDEKQFVIFTELMSRSVKKLLDPNPLCESCALRYTIQIIEGENLLLDNNDNVKLADFGVALKIILRDGRTQTEQETDGWPNFRGTILYAAPEVRANLGNTSEIRVNYGRKADIWSLACTIFEMVTGAPPYSKEYNKLGEYNFLMLANSKSFPFSYSDLPVPESCSVIKNFLKFLFVVDTESRPSAADAMQYLRKPPAEFIRNPNVQTMDCQALFCYRHKWKSLLIGLALIFSVCGIALFFILRDQSTEPTTTPVSSISTKASYVKGSTNGELYPVANLSLPEEHPTAIEGSLEYLFVPNETQWWHALKYCTAWCGYLVSIKGQEENNKILALAKKYNTGLFSNYWIGLKGWNAAWYLDDESDVGYFNFVNQTQANEEIINTDNYETGCVQADSNSGIWSIANCRYALPFFCERNTSNYIRWTSISSRNPDGYILHRYSVLTNLWQQQPTQYDC